MSHDTTLQCKAMDIIIIIAVACVVEVVKEIVEWIKEIRQ